jgi:hypothetical protein
MVFPQAWPSSRRPRHSTAAGYRGLTYGLFKHDTNSIMFALVVDDFVNTLTGRCRHLIAALSPHYRYTTDWEAPSTVESISNGT